ncbi:MAG: hypothetical protein EPN82_16920 [Bacteroidetes bacterium]|nr:MAG: hypothetical protein EPN82_16920 [Bacteroidota bacterium]
MTKSEEHFYKIAREFPDSKTGKMFGALCIKNSKGKAFAMLWKDDIVVKLDVEEVNKALKLKGTKLFDPMGGRPMKEWVQMPYEYSTKWENYVKQSYKYVATADKKKR